MKRLALVLVCVAAQFCSAQSTTPADMKTLKAKYEQGLINIRADSEKALTNSVQGYAEALKALEQKLQTAGNLDGILAVRKEIDRYGSEKAIPASAVASDSVPLRELQLKWQKMPETIEINKSKKIVMLSRSHIAAVENVKKQLTMQGKLEEAVAAKEEIERVKSLPEVTAAEFVLASAGVDTTAPASPPPAAPPPVGGSVGKGQAKPGDTTVLDLGQDVKMEFVWVGPGDFELGSHDSEAEGSEKPAHPVKISKDFWIGKYEVTQEQWEKVMGRNPSQFRGAKKPVDQVSWQDCQEFLQRLKGLGLTVDGRKVEDFRLPSEAEWEYAAEGGSQSKENKYSGSDKIDEVGWYNGNSGGGTHPVGGKKANELGLFDMTGNVWEWCEDWYGPYSKGKATDPTGSSSGESRVMRGGSLKHDARYCRSAFRYFYDPSGTYFTIGIRVVMIR